MSGKAAELREVVKEKYGSIARERGGGCCGSPSQLVPAIGYTAEEVAQAGEANLGLGCGNPLALAQVREGMTVVDLGSGAGFDAFLVRERVGASGRVIGVDMTDDMLALARENARRRGVANVEFRQGVIEALPVDDASADMVISNCVINLSPDKEAVFREIYRVLKPGGTFAISDIVLLRPLEEAVKSNVEAYVGCVAGASMLSEYVALAAEAGFTELAAPQIMGGAALLCALAPGATPAGLTAEQVKRAAAAVASVRFHGAKPVSSF